MRADCVAAMLKMMPVETEKWLDDNGFQGTREVADARKLLAGETQWFSDPNRPKGKKRSKSELRIM